MSNIRMVEAALPPGFRFHPRDEELICDYLMKKVSYSDSLLLLEVDLNKCEPWDIPETACVGGKEWYFYSQKDRKYATGVRTNRATASGYWKATGKDRPVLRKGTLVGMRKTLVFYEGRAPKGRKTNWVMHEFRLEGPLCPTISSQQEDWVLCRVFHKNREILGTQESLGSHSDVKTSSSLPPLMDTYITFDQTQPNLFIDECEKEQVPCFSIFSQNHTFPLFPSIFPEIPQTEPKKTHLDSYTCDHKVDKKADLNYFSREAPSLGEGGSSESLLSEVAMPNIWDHF